MNASTDFNDTGADIHGVTLTRIELDHLISWHALSVRSYSRCGQHEDVLYHIGRISELKKLKAPRPAYRAIAQQVDIWRNA